jgi:hypothetical protein
MASTSNYLWIISLLLTAIIQVSVCVVCDDASNIRHQLVTTRVCCCVISCRVSFSFSLSLFTHFVGRGFIRRELVLRIIRFIEQSYFVRERRHGWRVK